MDEKELRDVVLFKDITVSRKHFEILYLPDGNGQSSFFVRDLGSAGGTFIRIPFGVKKQLHPGMIILLGKHQFTVSSIDDGNSVEPVEVVSKTHNSINSDTILSMVENAERLMCDVSNDSKGDRPSNQEEVSAM